MYTIKPIFTVKSYRDDRGLLNSKRGEVHCENSPLYTLEHILQCVIAKEDCSKEIKDMLNFYNSCMISPGLYNQRPTNDGGHEDYMSHDQLTTMMCFFFFTHQTDKIIDVLDEIDRQGGHYDNVNPFEPKRYLRPWDRWFYQHLINECNSFKWLIVSIVMKISCRRKWKVSPSLWKRIDYFFTNLKFMPKKRMIHTDGKLLSFVRCGAMLLVSHDNRVQKLWDALKKIIDNHSAFKPDGMKKVFATYFPSDHPNCLLANKIWSNND